MSQALAAEVFERRGLARAALLDAVGALDDFAEAEALWSRAGAPDSVCRTWVHAATLQLRGLGNLHEAALWLEQARRARGPRGSDAWASATLARADLLFLRGNAPRAAALVDVVIRALEEANRPPGTLIAAALQGIAVAPGAEQDRFARLLCAQLERVTPACARLALLDRLDSCPPLSGAPELRARLRALVPSPVCAPATYPPEQRAGLALRDAELDRLVGRHDEAVLKLEHAWRKLGAESSHALAAAAARANARRLAAELAGRMPAEPAPVADGVALVQLAGVLDDAELRARALVTAKRLLDDHPAGVWAARLLELRARDAASAEHALEFRRRAAGVYEAMGDDARRDRALGRAPRRAAAPAAPVAGHELCVAARLRRGRLTLLTSGHAGRSGRLREGEALERVHRALAVPTARLLEDPAALARDLAAVLRAAVATVHGEGSAAHDDGARDVGLHANHTAVQALPWELAAPALEAAGLRFFRRVPREREEAADVRAVQGALRRLGPWPLVPDGNLGPQTARALRQLQGELGIAATGLPDPVTVQRLHGAVAGGDLPRVAIVGCSSVPVRSYERAGFDPLTADGRLAALLREHPVAVLHIRASLTDHHGTPALDLPARLTGPGLDRCLPRDLPSPLVVLDVPDEHLLLGNVFATQLSAVGTVRAILVTSHTGALPAALESGGDIVDVTRAIRAHGQALTALFARTAAIRFPAPAGTRL